MSRRTGVPGEVHADVERHGDHDSGVGEHAAVEHVHALTAADRLVVNPRLGTVHQLDLRRTRRQLHRPSSRSVTTAGT